MRAWISLSLALFSIVACERATSHSGIDSSAQTTTPATALVDEAVLTELLGEATQVEGDHLRVDGLLLRLAFEPLIRETGPVELQLVRGQGYRLAGVADGSPLWQLGLRDGDVLTQVDGAPIVGGESALLMAWAARPDRPPPSPRIDARSSTR